jgi:tetratricopeptide (TPR) repeat protein
MKILNVILGFLFLINAICFAQVDINNKIMLAQSFEQAGDYDRAAILFEEIYSVQPQNYQVFESLNRVYTQAKKYEKSVSLIQNRIKSNPKDINLFGMLGTTFYLMGNESKAFDAWEDGIKTQPENQMSYRIIANHALQRRAFEKAIDYLKRGKAVSENPELYAYDLANIYSLTMQYKEAAAEYCSLLEKQPTQLSAVENRILTYSNKPGALEQTIEVLENRNNNNNISFDYLLARLYVESKAFDKAYLSYQRIDERQQNKGAELYNFAQMVFNEGEYQLSAKIFEDIIKKYPASPYASQSKLGYAKTSEAILEAETSAVNPNWKPIIGKIFVDGLKAKAVINNYLELTNFYSNSEVAFEAFFRIGKIYFLKLNDLNEAQKYFERIIRDASLSRFAVESSEQLGKLFLLNGDLQKAKENYARVITNGRALEENRNYANYQLARISLFEGNLPDAKEKLGAVVANLKDNTANDAIELSLLVNTASADSSNLLKFINAEFLTEQKKFSEAADEYRKIALNPNAFILHHISKLREAEVVLAMDSVDKSLEILSGIIEEAEKNIYADKALYLAGKIYQYNKKNYPKAIEMFEMLLAKFPNSLYQDESRNSILEIRNKLS